MEYETKDIIGKSLFILSILLFLFMIFSPLAKTIIHIDEFWTIGVIHLPLSESMPVIAYDVHPPLYYLVLKVIFKALSFFGIQYNNIFVYKLFSILPLGLILIIFGLKIQKEYGWLTAGLFTFILVSVNMFVIQFLTVRMYNWGLFFLLMSFIYFKGILLYSDKKSWILFTICSIIVSYTHYFIFISTVLLYAILLAFILINKDSNFELKSQLKKWFLSVISMVIVFIPWAFTLLGQINNRQHFSEAVYPTMKEFINYLTFYTGIESEFSLETLFFKILAFAILILIAYIFIKEYRKDRSIENFYVGTGLILFYLSIIVGVIIVAFAFNIFSLRYLVSAGAIFWFSVCILIGKIKDDRLLIISLIAIFIICIAGFAETSNSMNELYTSGSDTLELFDSLNNNDTVIVYTQEFHYINFHHYLNETKEYKSEFYMPYPPKDITTIKNISEIPEKSNIYIIKAINFKTDDYFDNVIVDNITFEKYGNYNNIWVIHVK